MKKIFSFAAAMLLSVCAFADRATVPNPSDLAAFDPTTNAVLCAYFDEQVCNDIVLIGNYNGWNPATAVKMRPVTGFDGWYAAGVNPTDGSTGNDGTRKFKPVQLKADGGFSWDFQCGGPDAWVKANPAGADLDVQSETGGAECGLHYTAPGAYIYYCTAWKNHNTPCAQPRDYTVKVYAPECEYVEPTIAGGFDNWDDVNHEMDWDQDEQGIYYYFVMENQLPGIAFKIKGGEGWDNPIQKYYADDDNWKVVNYDPEAGEEVDWHLGEDTLIVFDWSDADMYRYFNCAEPAEEQDYTFTVTFPACEAATPAIVGSFEASGWETFVPMTLVEGTTYSVTVTAAADKVYKFADVVLGWGNELKNIETGESLSNIAFGEETEIVLDYSNDYAWAACQGTAVEEVATVKMIRKSIENGQLILNVNGVRYNAIGAKL